MTNVYKRRESDDQTENMKEIQLKDSLIALITNKSTENGIIEWIEKSSFSTFRNEILMCKDVDVDALQVYNVH